MSDQLKKTKILYRYTDCEDRQVFEKHFSRDFDLLSASEPVEAERILEAQSLSAMVLDSDQIDEALPNKAKEMGLDLFCAQLHSSIELSDIVRLLEAGLVDKFYAKPYDPYALRSDLYAASLGLYYRPRYKVSVPKKSERYVVLLVDDELTATKFLVKQLERSQCPADLVVADSAEQALELVDEYIERLAVVISDQRMPGMQGNQLLAHIRKHNPHVIRILTSAYREVDVALNAVNEGRIFRYVCKPWVATEINDLIKVALFEFSADLQKHDALNTDLEEKYQSVINDRRHDLQQHLSQALPEAFSDDFLTGYFKRLENLHSLRVTAGALRAAASTELEAALLEQVEGRIYELLNNLPLSNRVMASEVFDELLFRVIRPGIENESIEAILASIEDPVSRVALQCFHRLQVASGYCFSLASRDSSSWVLSGGMCVWLFKHLMAPVTLITPAFIEQQADLLVFCWYMHRSGRQLAFETQADKGLSFSIMVEASKGV